MVDIQRWYDTLGTAGVALVGVAGIAAYLCAKNAVYLSWVGWVFRRHIARLGGGSLAAGCGGR